MNPNITTIYELLKRRGTDLQKIRIIFYKANKHDEVALASMIGKIIDGVTEEEKPIADYMQHQLIKVERSNDLTEEERGNIWAALILSWYEIEKKYPYWVNDTNKQYSK